ncbi:Dicer-like protein 1 [Batrachochytrium dendrobatidis]|nr:Dicer-like protein 1 [Batrachochytrium dendrobatidis]KAK5667042.1 Dicer-like protein 1 [Batrachochytrium dendrobatidis]
MSSDFETINLLAQTHAKMPANHSNATFQEISSVTDMDTTDSPSYQSNVVEPRSYQLWLFELAKAENIIAVLPTGTGKTLIALLLIEHMHSIQSPEAANRKISVMLVPTIPLVSQQAQYIKMHSKLRTGFSSEGVSMKKHDFKYWKCALEENDVMVMTAEILKTSLDRGYISISMLNLIVFDECHHARNLHPYRVLMQTHYALCSEAIRPKIFGITASPAFGKGDNEESIKYLQSSLHCRAVTSTYESISNYVSSPVERVMYFVNSPFYELSESYTKIYECSGLAENISDQLRESHIACDVLGPWCADRMLEMIVVYYFKKLKQATDINMVLSKQLLEAESDNTPSHPDECIEQDSSDLDIDIDQLDTLNYESLLNDSAFSTATPIHKFCHAFISSPTFGPSNNPVSFFAVSPKVQCLIDILLEFRYIESFCGIVFVQQRSYASVIRMLIIAHPDLQFLKPKLLIGHGKRKRAVGGLNGMSSTTQQSVVTAFRCGDCNLLIATQVAEEGLDIRSCNAVIRFDKTQTLISYIQSRGRARQNCSQFIVLVNKDDQQEEQSLHAIQQKEAHLQSLLVQSVNEKPEAVSSFTCDSDDSDKFQYNIAHTGAVLNLYNSIKFLQEYCATLSVNGTDSQPIYTTSIDGDFNMYVTIQMPHLVRKECQGIQGSSANTIKKAKRLAAFEMVKLLHKFQEVDDHFNSCLSKTKYGAFVAKSKETSKKAKLIDMCDYPLKIPTALQGTWKDGEHAWVHIVHLQQIDSANSDTTGLLNTCFKPASDELHETKPVEIKTTTLLFCILTCGVENVQTEHMDLNFDGEPRRFRVVALAHKLLLTSDMIAQFFEYHFYLFSGVLRSQFKKDLDWSLLCVPIRSEYADNTAIDISTILPESIIDWDSLRYCQTVDQTDLSSITNDPTISRSVYHDMIVFDRVHYSRKYSILEIQHDKTPSSLVSDLNTFSTVKSFYKTRLRCREPIVEDQCLIYATKVPDPVQIKKKCIASVKTYVLPQFCTIYPVKRLHLYQGLYMPLVIRQLWHRLLATDLYFGKEISLLNRMADHTPQFFINIETLQTVLVASSTDLPYSYERLEILGDSFLKIHQSLHLFALNPSQDEGWLTTSRMVAEQNLELCRRATEVGLQGLILTTRFSRKQWVPPAKGHDSMQSMPKKILADVTEAIIGGCLIDGGIVGASEAVRSLLNRDYQSEWGLYFTQYQLHRNVTPCHLVRFIGDIDSLVTLRIEAVLNYTFQDKSILWEALTHSSSSFSICGLNYQRLEFLGDAVLSFIITKYLYTQLGSSSPGVISHLKSEMVCNQFLACVSIRLGLIDWLRVKKSDTVWIVDAYAQQVIEHLSQPADSIQKIFWAHMTTAPKICGDVYEAILGAIFVDSKFSIEKVDEFVLNSLIKPWWDHFSQIVQDGKVVLQNSIVELRDLVAEHLKCSAVEYTYTHIQNTATVAIVKCHDKIIGKAIGTGKRDAKKAASKVAAEYILRYKEDVASVCDCHLVKPPAI